jgi:hypothetical protein
LVEEIGEDEVGDARKGEHGLHDDVGIDSVMDMKRERKRKKERKEGRGK